MIPWARSSIIVGALVAVGVATPSFSQPTLYGAANIPSPGVAPSRLFTIDPSTGVATLIGPIGFDTVTGMTFLPDGRLVASAVGDALAPPGPSAILIEIDPLSGTGSLIGTIDDLGSGGNCGRMLDISWDDVTGTLFGHATLCSMGVDGRLYRIDPTTGTGTLIGSTGFPVSSFGDGMDVDSAGVIHATPLGSLITIDPATGAGTQIGTAILAITALDFHPESGVLYGSHTDTIFNNLVTIDKTTGATTFVGSTTVGLNAIAFTRPVNPVPVLGAGGLTLLCLILAVVGLATLRRIV